MTRARALKQAIRARAARTGERYTTARRHILDNETSADHADSTPPAKPPAAAAPPALGRSGIADATLTEKTGHGSEHWFDVLDRFNATKKGHTAAARHLSEDHGVGGWYAQSITVAYERARGLRTVNQRPDGRYEVSVSKMVAGDVPSIIAAFGSRRQRRRLRVSNDGALDALAAALDAPSSTGFVVRQDGQGRFRYKWGSSIVQFHLYPKAPGKTSVVVTNMKLPSRDMVEERRTAWRGVLNALAAAVQR
jgi:hypothetical protein